MVVSENVAASDTASLAHVLLPAPRGARRTARSRTPNAASRGSGRSCRRRAKRKPDWWIVAEVAQRMGLAEAFGYRSRRRVFREHAELSGIRKQRHRAFDIGGLAGISDEEYDAFEPIQWPVREKGGRHRALVRRRRILAPPIAARFIVPSARTAGRPRDRRHGRWCSTPAASAISGTR